MPRTQQRRHFTAEQKVAILREHLLERKPISEICDRHKLQPSVFYDWQKRLFENGAAAMETTRDPEKLRLEREVETLKVTLSKKDHIIARVTEEFVNAKKASGET